MAITFSYPLIPSSPSSGGGGGGSGALFGPGVIGGACTPFVLTQDQLLAVLDSVLAPNWLDPIKVGENGGWELFRAYAKMWERVSLAVGRFECNSYISSAHGPARATVNVQFLRPTAGAGAVTVKSGSLVRASSNGATFRTIVDAVFGALDLGPITVAAEAVGYGEEFNVAGQYIAPDGGILAGEIDTFDLPLLDPPFGDTSIYVVQIADAVGGSSAALDLYGAERDTYRIPGEDNAAYAARIRAVPDVVTPAAIRRQVDRWMKSIGYTPADWYLVETWEHRFQECYDAPESSFTFEPDYSADLFAFDDPRDPAPVRNRWHDETTIEGAFILEMVDIPAVDDLGFAYDDPAETVAELASSLGRRGTPALDIPAVPIPEIRGGALDGVDLARNATYLRLSDLLNSIKAFGVRVVLHARGD